MKRLFYPIIICLMSMACQGQKTGQQQPQKVEEFRSVSVEEFAQVIADPRVVLLDVRRLDEHEAGHIAGTTLHIDVLHRTSIASPWQVSSPRAPWHSIAVVAIVANVLHRH